MDAHFKHAKASLALYVGAQPCAQTLHLLAELGFVQDEQFPSYYNCLAERWRVVFDRLTIGKAEAFFEPGKTDDVEKQLREDGFPVDRILRTKRLRALVE